MEDKLSWPPPQDLHFECPVCKAEDSYTEESTGRMFSSSGNEPGTMLEMQSDATMQRMVRCSSCTSRYFQHVSQAGDSTVVGVDAPSLGSMMKKFSVVDPETGDWLTHES
jgi:hypothetical protein